MPVVVPPITSKVNIRSEETKTTQNVKGQEIHLPRRQNVGGQGITLQMNHPWEEEAKGAENVRRYHSTGSRVSAYLKTDGGLFRVGQLMDRAPRFINAVYQQLGVKPSLALHTLSSRGLTSWTWLTTFPRLVTMTPGVIESVKDARKAAQGNNALPNDQVQYKVKGAIRDTTDFAAMLGYGSSMVVGLFPQGAAAEKAIRFAADNFTLAHDAISLDMNVRNFQAIRQVDLEKATSEMQQTVAETRKQNMLAIAKDVASIVSGAVGIFFVMTGFAVLPGILLVAVSLASTVLAVIRDLYKDTMSFKPIEIFNNKHVTQLTA